MSTTKKQIEFKMFDNFRVTHHLGSELIEIEVLTEKKSLFIEKYFWKRIYIGPVAPIQFSLDWWNKSQKDEEKN